MSNFVLSAIENASEAADMFGQGLVSKMLSPAKSNFTNIAPFAVVIFLLIIAITISILILMATYKLTGSGLQTILCLFFGRYYLMFAFIYYGFAGYKFVKK